MPQFEIENNTVHNYVSFIICIEASEQDWMATIPEKFHSLFNSDRVATFSFTWTDLISDSEWKQLRLGHELLIWVYSVDTSEFYDDVFIMIDNEID